MAPALPPGRRWSLETLKVLLHRLPDSFCQLTREELLWASRTVAELHHRQLLYRYDVQLMYSPSLQNANRPPKMEIRDFVDTCNKSVPVYIPGETRVFFPLLSIVLHNYIYRRWFRPYRSEIEYQRFLCKFIRLTDLPEEPQPSRSTITTLATINRAMCTEVEACRRRLDRGLARGEILPYTRCMEDTRHHIIQPLFRAIFMIAYPKDYHYEDSSTVGRLPVYLGITGVTDGLSAPITFESIADKIDVCIEGMPKVVRTTLETATDFIINLEARETAALGLKPDPAVWWKNSQCRYTSYLEKWTNQPPVGPSSQFVDMTAFPEWQGYGQDCDSGYMVAQEKLNFRRSTW